MTPSRVNPMRMIQAPTDIQMNNSYGMSSSVWNCRLAFCCLAVTFAVLFPKHTTSIAFWLNLDGRIAFIGTFAMPLTYNGFV